MLPLLLLFLLWSDPIALHFWFLPTRALEQKDPLLLSTLQHAFHRGNGSCHIICISPELETHAKQDTEGVEFHL